MGETTNNQIATQNNTPAQQPNIGGDDSLHTNLVDGTPISKGEDGMPEKIGFVDAKLRGLNAGSLGNSNYSNRVYLEDEASFVKKMGEMGLGEKNALIEYGKIKDEYEDLKLGLYNHAQQRKNGVMAIAGDVYSAPIYSRRVQADLYSSYGLYGKQKYANDYTYIDQSKYRTYENGELVTKDLGLVNRMLNPGLVIKYDYDKYGNRVGTPYIQEEPFYNDLVYETPYNAWGGHDVYGSHFYDGALHLLSGIVPESVKFIGQLGQISDNLYKGIFGEYAGLVQNTIMPVNSLLGQVAGYGIEQYAKKFEDAKGKRDYDNDADIHGDYYEGIFNTITNVGRRWEYQASDAVNEDGWFGSGAGFAHEFGVGLGQFLVQVGAAMLTMGGSTGAEATMVAAESAMAKQVGKKVATKQMEKTLAKTFLQKSMTYSSKYAMIGTAQMMGSSYEELVKSGVDKSDAAIIITALSPITYFTEKLIGFEFLKAKIPGEVYQSVITKRFSKTISQFTKNRTKQLLTENGTKRFTRAFAKGLVKDLKELKLGSAVTKSVGALVGGGKAAMGGLGKATVKAAQVPGLVLKGLDKAEANIGWKFFNPASIAKGFLYEGMQETAEQFGYMTGYWLYDKYAISQGAVQGQLTGYDEWGWDVVGKKGRKELWQNFTAGAILGGTIAAFKGNAVRTATDQNYVALSAIKGEGDEVRADYIKRRAELFGSTEITPDGKALTKNGSDKPTIVVPEDIKMKSGEIILAKGTKLYSQNDVNFYHALLEMNHAEKLADMQGFTVDDIARFSTKEGILVDAMKLFDDMKKTESQISSLQEQLSDKNTDESKKVQLKKDIAGLEKKRQTLKEWRDYLVNPDNDYTSIQEDINKIDSKIAELNKKEDITEYDKFQLKTLETEKATLENEMSKMDSDLGYSKGYKTKIKNALSMLEQANRLASNIMKLEEQTKGQKEVSFTRKEIEKFIRLRGKILSMTDPKLYDKVGKVETFINQKFNEINAVLKNLDYDKSKVEKTQKSFKEYSEKFNDLAGKAVLLNGEQNTLDLNDIDAHKAIYKRKAEIAKQTIALMDQFRKEIDLTSFGVRSSIKDIFGEFSHSLNNLYTQTELGTEDSIMVNLGFDQKANYEDIYDENEVLNNEFEKATSYQIDNFEEEANHEKELLKYLEMTPEQIKENIMFKEVEDELRTLEQLKKNNFTTENPVETSKRVAQRLAWLDTIKEVLYMRHKVITPLNNADGKVYLSRHDRTISDETFKESLNKVNDYTRLLEGYATDLDKILKANSNYFVFERMNHAWLNHNMIKLFFDIDFIKKNIIDEELKKVYDSIDVPDIQSPEAITESDKEKLVKAEKAINTIFDKFWEKRDIFKDKNNLKILMENTFYSDDILGTTWTRPGITSDMGYEGFATEPKSKMELKMRSFNNVITPDPTIEQAIAIRHFALTMMRITADVSPSQIANARYDSYNDENQVSSTEQIRAEDNVIAFLAGGNNTITKMMEIENEIVSQYEYMGKQVRTEGMHHFTPNFIQVAGKVQTGKTQQVTPQIIKIAKKLDLYNKFLLVTFSKDSIKNFEGVKNRVSGIDAEVQVKSFDEVLNEGFEEGQLIFWDESTLLGQSELDKLKENAKKHNTKVVLLGDKSQMSTIIGNDILKNSKGLESMAVKTAPIVKKFATSNPLLMELMEYFDNIASTGYRANDIELPRYYFEEGPNGRYGTKYNDTIDDVIKDFVDRVDSGYSNPEDISLIFITEKAVDYYLDKHPELNDPKYKSLITVLSIDKNNPNRKYDTIQGGRRKEVYIAYEYSDGELTKPFLNDDFPAEHSFSGNFNAIYTLTGRASQFISMIGDSSNRHLEKPSNFYSQKETVDSEKTKSEVKKWLLDTFNLSGLPQEQTKSPEANPTTEEGEVKGGETSNEDEITDIQKKRLNDVKELVRMSEEEDFKLSKDSNNIMVNKDGEGFKRVTAVRFFASHSLNEIFKISELSKSRTNHIKEESAKIGKVVDNVLRDFFSNKLGKWDSYRIETNKTDHNGEVITRNMFADEVAFQQYIDLLNNLAKEFKNKGEIVVTDAFRLFNKKVYVAGETDIITIDKNGIFHIYDLKSNLYPSKAKIKDGETIADAVRHIYKSPGKYNNRYPKVRVEGNNVNISDHMLHELQVSGYKELLENHPYFKGKKPIVVVGDIIHVLYNVDTEDFATKDWTISSAREMVPINAEYHKTNILQEIEDSSADDHFNTDDATIITSKRSIKVNGQTHYVNKSKFKYQENSTGKKFKLRDIEQHETKNGKEIFFVLEDANGNIFTKGITEFEASYSPFTEVANEDNSDPEETKTFDNEIEAGIESIKTIFHSTAQAYLKGSHYTTPAIIISDIENLVEAKKLIKYERSIRIFKALLVEYFKENQANTLHSVYHSSLKTYDVDSRSFKEYKDVITLEAPDLTVDDISNVLKNAPEQVKEDIKNLINEARGKNNSVVNTMKVLSAFATPEFDFLNENDHTANKIDTSKLSREEAHALIDNGFNQEGVDPDIINANKALNHKRVDILYYAKETGKDQLILDDVTLLQESNNGVPSKGEGNIDLDKFVNRHQKEGFEFGKIEFIRVKGKWVMAINYRFKGNKNWSKMTVFSRKVIDGATNANDISNYANSLISTLDNFTSDNISKFNGIINSSSFYQFLLTNYNSISTQGSTLNQMQINVGGKVYTLGNLFEPSANGMFRIKSLLKGKKTAIRNEKMVYVAIANEIKAIIDGSTTLNKQMVLDDLFMPFDKKSNDLSRLQTDKTRINVPMSFVHTFSLDYSNSEEIEEDDDDVPFMQKSDTKTYQTETVEKARSVIERILGKESAEWAGFETNLTYDGVKLFGMVKNGKIFLDLNKENKVNRASIRHEIHHVVYRYILNENTRERIRNAAREVISGSESMTNKEIEEWLSDWYGNHGSEYTNDRYSGFLGKFRMLLDKILGRYQLYSGELGQYFSDIENGKYQNKLNRQGISEMNVTDIAFSKKPTLVDSLDDDIKENFDNIIKEQRQKEEEQKYYEAVYDELKTKSNIDRALTRLSKYIINKSYLININKVVNSKDATNFTQNTTIQEAISIAINGDFEYLGDKEVKSTLLDGKKKKIYEVRPEEVSLLNSSEIYFYTFFKMSQNNNFRKGIIKALFPDIDFREAKNILKKDSTQYDSKKDVNVTKRMSSMVKFMTHSIRLLDFNSNDPIIAMRGIETGNLVDPKLAEEILNEVGLIASKDTINNSIDSFRNAFKNLITDNGGVRDNTIKSIQNALFGPSNAVVYLEKKVTDDNGKKVTIQKPAKATLNSLYAVSKYDLTKFKKDQHDEINKIKKDAGDLLTALVSYYSSITRKNMLSVKVSRNGFANITERKQSSIDEQKNAIKDTFKHSLYAYDSVSIRDNIKELYDERKRGSEKLKYNITSKGLLVDGKRIISKNKDGHWQFTEMPTKNILRKLSVMTALTKVYDGVFDKLLEDPKTKLQDRNLFTDEYHDYDDYTGNEFLADVFMNFMFMIKSNIKQQEALTQIYQDSDALPSARTIQETLTDNMLFKDEIFDFFKRFNAKLSVDNNGKIVGPNIDSNLAAIKDGMSEYDVKDFVTIKPTDLYSIFKYFGEMNQSRMITGRDRFVFINGKKLYAYDQLNTLLSIFHSPENGDSASYHIERQIENEYENRGLENSILLNPDGSSNNILISSRNNYFQEISTEGLAHAEIEGIYYLPGISNDFTDSDTLSSKDHLSAIMSAYIEGHIQSKGSDEIRYIEIGYNKRMYIVKLNLKNNLITGITFNNQDKINSVSLNHNLINKETERLFDYYYRSAELSRKRWENFFETEEGKSFTGKSDFFKLFKGENTNYTDFRGTKFNLTEEEIAALKHSGLIKGLDYFIGNSEEVVDPETNEVSMISTFGVGGALRFYVNGLSAISFENYKAIKDNGGLTNEMRMEMFRKDMKTDAYQWNNLLSNKNAGFSDIYGIKEYSKKQMRNVDAEIKTDSFLYSYDENDNMIFNNFYQGFFFEHLILSHGVTTLAYGNPQGSRNIVNYTKYNNPKRTGKTNVVTGTQFGLSKKNKVIVIKAPIRASSNVYLNGEQVEATDGETIGFAFEKIALGHSLGGQYKAFDDTMMKPVTTGGSLLEQNDMLIKEAIDFQTGQSNRFRRAATIQRNLVKIWNKLAKDEVERRMNDPEEVFKPYDYDLDLDKLFTNYLSQNNNDIEKAAEKMWDDLFRDGGILSLYDNGFFIRDILKETMPRGFTDETTVKRGASNINDIDISKPLTDQEIANIKAIDVENKHLGIINNPGFEVNENSTVAIMNQVLAHMFNISGPQIQTRIDAAMSNIQEQSALKMFSEIGIKRSSMDEIFDTDSWSDEEVDSFKRFIIENGKSALSKMGVSGTLELLENGADINLPAIAEDLMAMFRSTFNGKILKPRFRGIRAVQSSGIYHEVYTHSTNGGVYTYADLRNLYGNQADVVIDNGTYIERELTPMAHDEQGNFRPSEIIAPYMYKDKFFIKEGEDVSDVMALNFAAGKLHLRNTVQPLIEQGKTINQIAQEIVKYKNQLAPDEKVLLESSFTRWYNNSKGLDPDTKILFNKDIAVELAKYLTNFDKSLNGLTNRVPFDTPALGFISKIVSFSEGNGNTVYISPEENIRTGGDQDIDQLSIYFHEFNGIDYNADERTIEGSKNIILESIMEYYKNPNNVSSIYGTTGVKMLREAVRENKDYNQQRDFTMNSLSSILKMSESIVEGEEAIQIYAMGASSYAYLVQSTTKKTVKGKAYIAMTKANEEVLRNNFSVISAFLQGALDNSKEMILGEFNIPYKASGLPIALAAFGYSASDIYQMFHNPIIKPIIQQIRNSSNIDEKSVFTPLLINDAIEAYKKEIAELKGLLVDENNKVITRELIDKKEQKLAELMTELDNIEDDVKKENELSDKIDKLQEEIDNYFKVHNYADNLDNLNTLYEASVFGEALRRFGRFLSLRRGISTKSNDVLALTKELQLYLGKTIPEYLNSVKSGSTPTQLQEKHIKFYKANDNKFLDDRTETLIKIEKDIFKAINIPEILNKRKYLKSMVKMLQFQKNLGNKMFYHLNPVFEDIMKSYFNKQGLAFVQYPNQYMPFNKLASRVLIDIYEKENPEKFDIRIVNPQTFVVDKSSIFRNIDGTTAENRNLFKKQFPYFIKSIKEFLDMNPDVGMIQSFFKSVGIKINTNTANSLLESDFFNNLIIKGFEGQEKIMFAFSTDSNEARRIRLSKEFAKLPEQLKHLFQKFVLWDSELSYSVKGLQPIIGNDEVVKLSQKVNYEKAISYLNDESNRERILDYLAFNGTLRSWDKDSGHKTYTNESIKVKDSFVVIPLKSTGNFNKSQQRYEYERMTLNTKNGGFDTNNNAKLWYPEIQSIKLSAELENQLRAKSDSRVIRHFIFGSSYKSGVAVTDSGMVVYLTVNRSGSEVTVSRIHDISKAEEIIKMKSKYHMENNILTAKPYIKDHMLSSQKGFLVLPFNDIKGNLLYNNMKINNTNEEIHSVVKIKNRNFEQEFKINYKEVFNRDKYIQKALEEINSQDRYKGLSMDEKMKLIEQAFIDLAGTTLDNAFKGKSNVAYLFSFEAVSERMSRKAVKHLKKYKKLQSELEEKEDEIKKCKGGAPKAAK